MKNTILLLLAMCAMLVGCTTEPAGRLGLGECRYHSGFLWTDDINADTTFVTQSFSVDFSGFKENNQNPQADLYFCDSAANMLNLKQYEVWVNGQKLTSPMISLSDTDRRLDLRFRCIPSSTMKEGKKDILLKVGEKTNIDKVESNAFGDATITPDQATIIARMYFNYEQELNPWNVCLIWLLILLAALLFLIWSAIIVHRLSLPRVPSSINALQFQTKPLEANMLFSPSSYMLDDALKHHPIQYIQLVSSDTDLDVTHCEKWGIRNFWNMRLAWNGNIITINIPKNVFVDKITLLPIRDSSVASEEGNTDDGKTYIKVLVNDEKINGMPLKKNPDITLLAEDPQTKVWLGVQGYFHT